MRSVERLEVFGHRVEDSAHVAFLDLGQRLRAAGVFLEALQPVSGVRADLFEFLQPAQQRLRGVGFLEERREAVNPAVDVAPLGLQGLQLVAVAGLLGAPRALRHCPDDVVAADVDRHLVQHRLLEHRRADVGAAKAVVPGVSVPGAPVRRLDEAGEQVVGDPRARGPCVLFALQPRQNRLSFVIGDDGGVCVALDDPFAARPAPAGGGLILRPVHVPDGMPGVRQRGPFQMRQGALGDVDADLVCQQSPVLSGRAALQPCGDLGSRGWVELEAALGDGLSVPDLAGVDLHQAVSVRRAAAGPETLADVLGHAGEPLLARHQAVDLVHRLQHRVEDHLRDRVDLRHLGEDDVDAEFLAFVAEGLGDVAPPADAAGVVDQNRRPSAAAAFQVAQQLLEAWAVCVFAGLDGVAVFSGYDEAARLRQVEQLVALRLDRDRAPVLGRPAVEGGLFWHDGRG